MLSTFEGSPAALVLPAGQGSQSPFKANSFSPQLTVQRVFAPDASSPASLVLPSSHAVHTLSNTYSLAAQSVGSQVVSSPAVSSPASLVLPAGQAVQVPLATYSLAAHAQEALPPQTPVQSAAKLSGAQTSELSLLQSPELSMVSPALMTAEYSRMFRS